MPSNAGFFEFRPPLATGIFLGLLLAGAAFAPLSVSQLQAQVVVEERPPVLPVAEALDLLASGRFAGRGGVVIRAAFHDEPHLRGVTRPGNRDAYTSAERRQMLQAVEQAFLGRMGRDGEAAQRARSEANGVLHFLVRNIHQMAPEAREVPRLALRVFHQTEGVVVASSALSLLAAILPLEPPEAEEIREVFKDAIRGRYDKTLPSISFQHLLKACDAGLAIIEELNREGVRLEGAWHGWIPHVVEQGVSEEMYLKWLGQLPDCPPPGTRWPGGE